MTDLIHAIMFIGKGLAISLQLLFGSIILGMAIGLGLAILRYQNMGIFAIDRYISVVRGTPLLLQLSFIYFALPGLTGLKLGILSAGILSFGLNSAAYMAEVFRAGIESIPKGQFEAAQTLRVPPYSMWQDIILPQVLRHILPALTNETITLLKETALITTIGGMDVMRCSQILAAEKFTYFMPLCIAAAYYYGLVLLIELLGKQIEKRVSHVKN